MRPQAVTRRSRHGGAACRLDQAVPVEHGVDRALGRNAQIAVQPPDQKLADLARAPMRLVPLEGNDQALNLGGSWLA
jgi:hypothetical protein